MLTIFLFFLGRKKYEREYWFSVPKEKSKNLYHFFQKWAPEVYGDVDTLTGCEARGLEPINTDDELEGEEEEEEEAEEVEEEAKKKGGEDKENDAQKLNVVNAKSKFWRRRSPLNFLKLVEDHFSTEGMSTDWNVSGVEKVFQKVLCVTFFPLLDFKLQRGAQLCGALRPGAQRAHSAGH